MHLRIGEGDGLLHQFGDGVQRACVAPSKAVCQIEEGDDLVGEGLGSRHADLVAATERQRADRSPGEGGADHICQPKALHALFFGGVERVQHVFRLAGLADEQPHVLRTNGGQVLRNELRRQHGDHSTPSQTGEKHRPSQAGMIARAAANEIQVAGVSHFVHNQPHVGAASQHMQHFSRHLRLFVDLLEHKVGIAALLHGAHRFRDHLRSPFNQTAVLHGVQLNAVRPKCDDLAVLDADDGARERQDGGQVGRNAGEAFANAHHQPGAFLDGVELVVFYAANHIGIVALEVVVCPADGFDEIQPAVHIAFHRVHAGFAVVLRTHHKPLVHKHLTQLHIVDNVTVVRPNHVAVRVEVRLGVDL